MPDAKKTIPLPRADSHDPADDTFAFIIHPIDPKSDVARKWPWLGNLLTENQVNFFSAYFPPVYMCEVNGITSVSTGRGVRGWFIACPFTPQRMMQLPVNRVYDKITACGNLGARLGARMIGLGAYTSVVGDGGRTIADRLKTPVTTGDSYTVIIALEAIRKAAEEMGITLENAKVAVVGATGAIGKVCAQILSREVAELSLVGRRDSAIQAVREQCEGRGAHIRAGTDVSLIYDSDVVITVTSAIDAIIHPEHLKPGAVVCDVARPRDVSRLVAEARDDVLVIEGGMVEVPGPVDFGMNFGLPPRMAFACMAETIALALEGRYEDYTVGKELSIERCLEIGAICAQHGFKLGGFRSFEREVGPVQIAEVRERAAKRRKLWSSIR